MNADQHGFSKPPLELSDETGLIIGCAMDVSNTLGPGFLEKVYEKALAVELTARNIPFASQSRHTVTYKGQGVGDYIADFVVFGRIIVEIKAQESLTGRDRAQAINYLRATGFRVGLVINFGQPRLTWERVVYG